MKTLSLYIYFTIVITLCLQISCTVSGETEIPLSKVESVNIPQGLREASNLYEQRRDISKLHQAVESVGDLRDPENRNFEVESAYAKYCYFLGLHSVDEAQQQEAFENGKEAAGIAMRMQPGRPDGHFWFGANLGELCKLSPVTVGLTSVEDVRSAMNKVISIDPHFQNGSAYDALAQVELATRLNGGSAEKAVALLEKGLATDDENANIRLDLARAYYAVGRDADAKKTLDGLLKMKPNAEYLPEHESAVEEGRKLVDSRK